MSAAKTVLAGVLSLLIVVLTASLLLRAGLTEPLTSPEATNPGRALWETRDFETILQGLLILSGVFAILMLLKATKQEAGA